MHRMERLPDDRTISSGRNSDPALCCIQPSGHQETEINHADRGGAWHLPERRAENIAKGKIKRFFKDNTLVNQTYIKDSKQSVSAYVKSVHADLNVTGFKRLALG